MAITISLDTAQILNIVYYNYYRYSALGPVWAETRSQSGDWYGSGTLYPVQVLRCSLPLLSPNIVCKSKIKKRDFMPNPKEIMYG